MAARLKQTEIADTTPDPANDRAGQFSELEEVPLVNGQNGERIGTCYKTTNGINRTGILPMSGVTYTLRPKKVKDTLEIEKAMGGSEAMMSRIMEQTARVLSRTVIGWDDQPNVTKSQLDDLYDEDFEHLMLVIASFRSAGQQR